MRALLIVDMLNDFASGADVARVMRIVPSVRRLLDHARANEDWLVVYANDAHRADDPVVQIMGRHAMAGTQGAMVMEALAPIGAEREIVVSKRFYGAFEGTDLDDILYEYEVEDIVIAGQHTDGSILHTVYSAFCSGYGIHIPADAVCAGEGVDEKAELGRMSRYGVDLTTSTALIGRPVLRMATSRRTR